MWTSGTGSFLQSEVQLNEAAPDENLEPKVFSLPFQCVDNTLGNFDFAGQPRML